MAKVVLGTNNLAELCRRAELVAENRQREAAGKKLKRLPVLTHYRGRLHGDLVEDLVA